MKPLYIATTALALIAVSPLHAQSDNAQSSEEAASGEGAKEAEKVKPKKITDRSHPDYVRCKREKIIGSLSRKRRICLTNRQWKEVANDQNRLARELAEENTNRPGGN